MPEELTINSKITLNDGNQLPIIGFGTSGLGDGDQTENAVHWALDAGYRHIDTASRYGNEEYIGKAVREHRIDRKDVWVTTKLWPTQFASPKKALMKSLEKLGLDYVDQYLIHWPPPVDIPGLDNRLWQVLESFKNEGLVRSIGISNFKGRRLQRLVESAGIKPSVNQVECSPFAYPETVHAYCDSVGITLVAYSPLHRAENMDNQTLQNISERYGKTPAQLMLRWSLQKGIVPIPKSGNRDRIQENIDIFDFEITQEDIYVINKIGNAI